MKRSKKQTATQYAKRKMEIQKKRDSRRNRGKLKYNTWDSRRDIDGN